MLNISENRIEGKIDTSKYVSFSLVRDYNAARILSRLVVISMVVFFIALFLPWTQNITSNGFVTTLQPDQRPQTINSIISGRIEKWFVRDPFDAILLDAPCSATGTIRRHPDLPYLKQESDITELVEIQRRLLKKAVSLLKPGGHLVYCTCSLEEEEGYDQIKWLVREDPKLTLSPIGIQESRGQAQWMASGVVRTLPFHGVGAGADVTGLDGFFAARIIKNP